MERLRRIANLWNWLPAFRAVAESEHLPTAAERFHVSPSSLSRTIRLLEEDVGQPLFRRTGRRIELTEAGEVMLRVSRDAMRLVHDGLLEITGGQIVGELHLSAHGVWAHAELPALVAALSESHPGLTPRLHSVSLAGVGAALLRGQLDVALISHRGAAPPLRDAELTRVPLAESETRIYRARGDRTRPDQAPFLHGGDETPDADIPGELQVVTAAVCDDTLSLLQLCARGVGQCAVPTRAVAAIEGALPVSAVRGVELPASRLYALHRVTLAESGRAEAVVKVMRGLLD